MGWALHSKPPDPSAGAAPAAPPLFFSAALLLLPVAARRPPARQGVGRSTGGAVFSFLSHPGYMFVIHSLPYSSQFELQSNSVCGFFTKRSVPLRSLAATHAARTHAFTHAHARTPQQASKALFAFSSAPCRPKQQKHGA